jgi:hypothetical protein
MCRPADDNDDHHGETDTAQRGHFQVRAWRARWKGTRRRVVFLFRWLKSLPMHDWEQLTVPHATRGAAVAVILMWAKGTRSVACGWPSFAEVSV